MGAQEVHDAIKATLKPGEWALAEVFWSNGVSAACYVGPEGLKYTSNGKVWPYDVTIVRLLDTRTDDADWVEVTSAEFVSVEHHSQRVPHVPIPGLLGPGRRVVLLGIHGIEDAIPLVAQNGIALLPGWSVSRGAQLERKVGHALGLAVLRVEVWLDYTPEVES